MKKTWLILEDEFDIAEELIKQILKFKEYNDHCKEDDILWFYANTVLPQKPKVERSIYTQRTDVRVNYCSKETFGDEFITINGPVVLLCDIRLEGINEFNINDPKGHVLKKALSNFLHNNRESIIYLTTSDFGKEAAKQSLAPFDNRVYFVEGQGINLNYAGSREDSAIKIIPAAHQFLMDYMHPQILPKEFFKQLRPSKYPNESNFPAGISIKTAHEGWGESEPPKQFQNLARLLGYPVEELARSLNLIKPNGNYINEGDFDKHCVIESLKTFGTSDSQCFSPVAAIYLAWAAYRKRWTGEQKQNAIFVDAINKIQNIEKPSTRINLSRYNSIVAKQSSNESEKSRLLNSYLSFYEMMEELFSKKADSLVSIIIREQDLYFRLRMKDARNLAKKLSDVHLNLLKIINSVMNSKKVKKELNEHFTSVKILKFLISGAVSDVVDEFEEYEDLPSFIGAEYHLEISPCMEEENMIFLKFCKA